MKKQILKTAIFIAALTTSLAAYAVPTMIVTDGVVSSGPITTPGGGSVVYVNPAFGSSWSVVITAGTTKPLFGSATSPNMEIDIQATATGASPVHDLTVVFSDTDFGPTSGRFSALMTGQAVAPSPGGTVTFDTYFDVDNNVAAATSALTVSGGVQGPLYNFLDQGGFIAGAPYSLTEVVTISGTPAASYSLGANLQSLSLACAGGTGLAGVPYSSALVASGGNTPYTFSIISGSLPPGLTLDTTTGAITGTPTNVGTFSYVAQVVDATGRTTDTTILGCGITITPPPLGLLCAGGIGQVGVPYFSTLVASGGTPPYTNFSIISGSLPPGLMLDANSGAITGTPTIAGTFPYTTKVTDSAGSTADTASLNCNITIGPPTLTLVCAGGSGEVGVPYSSSLFASGGTPPYTNFSIISGSLPPGLILNTNTGAITGTPTAAGSFPYTAKVTDSTGATSDTTSLTCNITIIPGPALLCSGGSGVVGSPFTASLVATGGVPPYVFSLIAGSLPPGLTLNTNTGVISGTPTAAGTSSFTVQVKDANGATAISVCTSGCGSTCNNSWNFSTAPGALGTSQTYTISGITITAYGFTNASTPAALYGKTAGGDESGLGIKGTVDSEITTTTYIQLDLAQVIASGAQSGTMVIGSVQSGEGYDIYGSSTLGALGTLLLSNGTIDFAAFPIPGFPTYRYLGVRAHAADVLLDAVTFTCAGTCSITIGPPACTASICGSVLRDCDANGNLTGEAGLAGVLVALKDASGATLTMVSTDNGGNYCFSGLNGGAYTVMAATPAGYRLTAPSGCTNNSIAVTLANCQTKTGVNFGFTGNAPAVHIVKTGPVTATCGQTITYVIAVTNTGNTCFYGGLEVNDPLLGGRIFYQTPVSPGQGFVITTNYVVKSTDPTNLVNTATAIGHPPTGSAVSDQSTVTTKITPCCTSSVCGLVFRDCNADGSVTGDIGLAGVNVSLKNSSGAIVAVATTDANGNYCFYGLNAGSYRVVITPPAKYKQTTGIVIYRSKDASGNSWWLDSDSNLHCTDGSGEHHWYDTTWKHRCESQTGKRYSYDTPNLGLMSKCDGKDVDVDDSAGKPCWKDQSGGTHWRDNDGYDCWNAGDGCIHRKDSTGNECWRTQDRCTHWIDLNGKTWWKDKDGNCFHQDSQGHTCSDATDEKEERCSRSNGNDNEQAVCLATCENKKNVNFGFTGTVPAISLTQTANKTTAKCGDTVTYTFVVTDTGNTCFYGGITVFDSLLGGTIFTQTPVSPGQSFTFTKQYVVTSSSPNPFCNSATATGHVPTGIGLSDVTSTATTSVRLTLCASCTPPSVTCSKGFSQTFTCNPCFGTGPYKYKWSTGSTSTSISCKTAGTYTCTVTDAKGASCQAGATLTLK